MEPRVVMVRRRTEFESLMQEHGTVQMATFQFMIIKLLTESLPKLKQIKIDN